MATLPFEGHVFHKLSEKFNPKLGHQFLISFSRVLQYVTQSSYTITYPLPTESVIFILIKFVDFGTPCQSSILVYLQTLLKDNYKLYSGIILSHTSVPMTHINSIAFVLVAVVSTVHLS